MKTRKQLDQERLALYVELHDAIQSVIFASHSRDCDCLLCGIDLKLADNDNEESVDERMANLKVKKGKAK